jgi:photosystem II stability/assembly factor-like uncharacterized protein
MSGPAEYAVLRLEAGELPGPERRVAEGALEGCRPGAVAGSPMTGDRTLYVGTDHALYRARPSEDGRWRAEGLALAGLGGVRGLVIDGDNPRRWWACTAARGVLATADEGIAWRESNHGITHKEGWCLARDARSGELWYGAAPASVFRSADGGETWVECDAIGAAPGPGEWDETGPPQGSHVRHIALGDGGLVLAAVEHGWLLRSGDGGVTWTRVRDGVDRDCHSTTLLPGEPHTVIVTTGCGIVRSEDAGLTFAPSDDGLRHQDVTQVVVHPNRPEVLFTAGSEADPAAWDRRGAVANAAFYRSDDGGRTWWRLTGGLPEAMRTAPTCVAGDPGDPDSLYVGMVDGSVWLSEDGGESFRIAVEGIQGGVRHLLLTRR